MNGLQKVGVMTVGKEKIIGEMDSLPDDSVVFLMTDAANHNEAISIVLAHLLQDKKLKGVFVCVNKPAKRMISEMERSGIDSKGIFFIDCSCSSSKPSEENVVCLDSPKNLNKLSKALVETVQASSDRCQFIIIDSISTLMLFNSPRSVAQFGHLFTNLVREYGIKGVIFALEKETHEFVRRTLYVLSDKAIQV